MKRKEQLMQEFKNLQKPDETDFWEWQDSYWHKDEMIPKDSVEGLNESFFQEGKETLTVLEQPTLTGNILTLNYVGENGVTQSVNVDLSSLHTLDVNVSGAIFNASNNIITLTETDGESFQIDLSQLQIVATTDSNGTTTVSQEGSNKLTISKAGQSGNYSDLSGLPDLTAFVTLSNLNSKADKSVQINTTTPLQGGGDLSGNRTISIQQANSLQNGYLSNTDWNTFNNKMTAPTMTNNNVGRWDNTNKKFIDGVIQDDGTNLGIGGSPDTNTLPARIKINSINQKFFNLPVSNSTMPATINSGDIFTAYNRYYTCQNTNAFGTYLANIRPIKMNGLQIDWIGDSYFNVAQNFDNVVENNQQYGDSAIIHSGLYYGNTIMMGAPTSVGVDSRMYEGYLFSFRKASRIGINYYIDAKGNFYIKSLGGQYHTATEWGRSLLDRQNSTTTLGSDTIYPKVKWAVDSTTQGAFIAPRMTTAQRQAITGLDITQKGMVVYDTDLGFFMKWTGSIWTTLGANISNADLTNTAARIFTQGANFTWATQGNPYKVTGLLDKSTDTTFNKFLVEDSNGQVAYSDGAMTDTITLTTSTNITILTNDSAGNSQRGKDVIIDNGANNVTIMTDITSISNFKAGYIKAGTGSVTFIAGVGTTLIQQDYTNVMNGTAGSYAYLTRVGNTFYLRIYNA